MDRPQRPEKKYSVLYVDDEESNLRIFKTVFKRFYRIYTAISPEEGHKVLEEKDIQLIVTDQKMPKTTGVQFLSQVLLENPVPMRVILTGFSDLNAIVDAINIGHIHRYVSKPWDKESMKQIMDEVLEVFQKEQDTRDYIENLKSENERLKQEIDDVKHATG